MEWILQQYMGRNKIVFKQGNIKKHFVDNTDQALSKTDDRRSLRYHIEEKS